MPVILGGQNARKTWKRGQFGLSLQYVNGEESLCVWPLRGLKGAGAMVIGLSAAHLYADSKTGGPTPHLIESCMSGLSVMNIDYAPWALKALADVILDELPELVNMKPEPMEADTSKDELLDVDIRDNKINLVLH